MAQWADFAIRAREEPSHFVEEETDWYIVLVDPAPPHRRQYISHQSIGGMDFIQVLSKIGRVDSIDLFRAFDSVAQKLCGLTHMDDEIAIKLVVPLRGFDLTDWRWPLAAMSVYLNEVIDDAHR